MLWFVTRAHQSASVLFNGWRWYVLSFSSEALQRAYIRFWWLTARASIVARARLVVDRTSTKRQPARTWQCEQMNNFRCFAVFA